MTSPNFGRRYFSSKPHKSFYFWLLTSWMLVIIGMALVLAKLFLDHRNFGGVGGGLLWMCLSVAGLVILWLRAWRSHSKLYQIVLDSPELDETDEKRFASVLAQAAYLEYVGLSIALLVAQFALIGFAKLMGK